MAVDATAHKPAATMDVALKIWRYRRATGERELKRVRGRGARLGDAARRARHHQGPGRRDARLPQELPDDDLRLLRDAHGRRAPCSRARRGCTTSRSPATCRSISAMGNLPIVKDLVVDMEPVLGEVPGDEAVAPAGLRPAGGRQGVRRLAGADERHPQGVALHQLRLLRLGVQLDGVGARSSSARRRSRRGCASSATRATARKVERLDEYSSEHGIWDCTRCYFCNERCPKGVDPRDAIAKLGAEAMKEGIDHDMGAKHANWFVTSAKTTGWLRETELVPKTQGVVSAIKRDEVRDGPAQARQGAAAGPAARRRGRRRSRARSTTSSSSRAGTARSGSCRASTRSRGSSTASRRASTGWAAATRPTSRPARSRRGRARRMRTVAYYKGCLASLSAKELDISTQALSPKVGPRADRARGGHLLRRRRHPRGGAGLLPPPERAHPRLRRGDGLGHADDGLQRLHAQPAAGELRSSRATRRCSSA